MAARTHEQAKLLLAAQRQLWLAAHENYGDPHSALHAVGAEILRADQRRMWRPVKVWERLEALVVTVSALALSAFTLSAFTVAAIWISGLFGNDNLSPALPYAAWTLGISSLTAGIALGVASVSEARGRRAIRKYHTVFTDDAVVQCAMHVLDVANMPARLLTDPRFWRIQAYLWEHVHDVDSELVTMLSRENCLSMGQIRHAVSLLA